MTGDTSSNWTLGQLGNMVQALQCADSKNVYGLIVEYGSYFVTITVYRTGEDGEKMIKSWTADDIEVGVSEIANAIAEML